jgi:uncharacterized protein YfaT (DUF1175 family)
MITNVYSTNSFVTAHSLLSETYINPGNASAGLVRYLNNQIQVYDGSSWLPLGGTAAVGLSPEAEEIMNWAREKMQAEREACAMSEQYPAVADALNAVWESEQQLKTIVALCRT